MSQDTPIWGTPEQYARDETFKAVNMAARLGKRYGLETPEGFSTWAEHFANLRHNGSTENTELASAAGNAALRTMPAPEGPTPQNSMQTEAWIQALRYTIAAGLLAATAPGRSVALSKLARDTLWMIKFVITPPTLDHVPTWSFYEGSADYPLKPERYR